VNDRGVGLVDCLSREGVDATGELGRWTLDRKTCDCGPQPPFELNTIDVFGMLAQVLFEGEALGRIEFIVGRGTDECGARVDWLVAVG
jgi:hypothetical protein